MCLKAVTNNGERGVRLSRYSCRCDKIITAFYSSFLHSLSLSLAQRCFLLLLIMKSLSLSLLLFFDWLSRRTEETRYAVKRIPRSRKRPFLLSFVPERNEKKCSFLLFTHCDPFFNAAAAEAAAAAAGLIIDFSPSRFHESPDRLFLSSLC